MASRVSVIVPLYNKALYIARCLDSILGQTFADFELIVVNDGSTDESPDIVRRYKDPRLRLVSRKNAGPGAARNYGASIAQGEILAMLDGDDEWEPEYIESTLKWMDSCRVPVASVTWGMTEYPHRRSTESRWRAVGMPDGVFRATAKTPGAVVIGILANALPSSTAVRRSAFLEAGGFYAKNRCLFSEDAYLWLKLMFRNAMAFDPRPLVRHYLDAGELSVNLKGVRPIEPFLTDPDGLTADCPAELRPLLREVLSRRALKTASVYGYWGRTAVARDLMRRFVSIGDCRLPYFSTGVLGCTPVAAWIGAAHRAWLTRYLKS